MLGFSKRKENAKKVINPREELNDVVFLNVHVVKLSSKFLYL